LPTIWPVEDMDHSTQAFKESSGFSSLLWGLADNVSNCGKRPVEGAQFGVFNGLVDIQGPNYALAKTSQNWRAILALRDGSIVSSNFAPAGRTQSMLHSSTMVKVLNGMQAFPPALVLYPDTVSSIMGALLLYDITIPTAKVSMSLPPSHLSIVTMTMTSIPSLTLISPPIICLAYIPHTGESQECCTHPPL